jgi:hypothetical protein
VKERNHLDVQDKTKQPMTEEGRLKILLEGFLKIIKGFQAVTQ